MALNGLIVLAGNKALKDDLVKLYHKIPCFTSPKVSAQILVLEINF